MKLSVDSRLAQHWTFLLCDNEDDDEQRATDSLSLSTPRTLVLPPMTLKDPDSLRTVKPPPLLPAWTPTEARVDVLSQGTNRPADLQNCPWNLPERSIWSVSLSVCLSDRLTTLPQLHSQRLQWEITFLVNLIFFLSGLTFH